MPRPSIDDIALTMNKYPSPDEYEAMFHLLEATADLLEVMGARGAVIDYVEDEYHAAAMALARARVENRKRTIRENGYEQGRQPDDDEIPTLAHGDE